LYRKPVVVTDPKTGQKVKSHPRSGGGSTKTPRAVCGGIPWPSTSWQLKPCSTEIVKQVEREKAGLVDPTDRERKRPLAEHIADFRRYKENRDIGEKQISEVLRQLNRMVKTCKWRTIGDITARSLLDFLGDLRKPAGKGKRGLSAQTYNHYLRAAKQFTRWLLRDQRIVVDPLAHLSNINTSADRRHDRRALTHDEFTRLVAAARTGKRVEGMTGADRAMLYVLAGWTGFRKGELGSLTKSSFRLDGELRRPSPWPPGTASGGGRTRRSCTPTWSAELRTWLAGRPDAPAR
jgi:integrase/recombinase XerD